MRVRFNCTTLSEHNDFRLGKHHRNAQDIQTPENESTTRHRHHDDRRQRQDVGIDDHRISNWRSSFQLQQRHKRFHILWISNWKFAMSLPSLAQSPESNCEFNSPKYWINRRRRSQRRPHRKSPLPCTKIPMAVSVDNSWHVPGTSRNSQLQWIEFSVNFLFCHFAWWTPRTPQSIKLIDFYSIDFAVKHTHAVPAMKSPMRFEFRLPNFAISSPDQNSQNVWEKVDIPFNLAATIC